MLLNVENVIHLSNSSSINQTEKENCDEEPLTSESPVISPLEINIFSSFSSSKDIFEGN